MADAMPNYRLERKKLEVQVGQLKQNRLATELRVMQLEHDLEQANKNVESLDAAIADLEAQAETLTQGEIEHG